MDLYITVNSVVNSLIFFFLALPGFILCVLCVVGLLLAQNMKWQMLVLLVNIFAVEVCFWLAVSVAFIGFPFRAYNIVENDFSCNVGTSLFFVNQLQKFTSIAIYAIMVYFFMKDGIKKVKWYAFLPYIVISWVVALALATIPYFPAFGTFNNNRFCSSDSQSIALRIIFLVIFFGLRLVCFCLITVFSILT